MQDDYFETVYCNNCGVQFASQLQFSKLGGRYCSTICHIEFVRKEAAMLQRTIEHCKAILGLENELKSIREEMLDCSMSKE